MQRIIETSEISGLSVLLGEKVLLICCRYFYVGELIGVNEDHVELKDPCIVYETGPWTASEWKDVQELLIDTLCVAKQSIEAFGKSPR